MKKELLIRRRNKLICCIFSLLIFISNSFAEDFPKKVTPKELNEWRTGVFEQWLEVKKIFPNDEAPSIIIHCKGRIGAVGEWKTDTICWPNISEHEVTYYSLPIATYNEQASGSGIDITEYEYWGIDVNDDTVDDLLIFQWNRGEYKKGDETIIYDEPKGIRIVQRKASRNFSSAIISDNFFDWSQIKKSPEFYKKLIYKIYNKCDDPKWKKRLKKAMKIMVPHLE